MAQSDVYCNVVMHLDEVNFSNKTLFTLTFIKMKSYLLEVHIRFFNQTLSMLAYCFCGTSVKGGLCGETSTLLT